MTDKERITEILKAYTKKHNIMASSVILEEYAEELVKQGVVMPIRCKDCIYHIAEYCTRDIKGRTNMFYMTADDYCSKGERKDGEQ